MPTNINVVLSDKSYENLQKIKKEARFRTNADVVQFALDVAVHSQAFENLKTGRLVEAFPPQKPSKDLEKLIEEIVEKKLRERRVQNG